MDSEDSESSSSTISDEEEESDDEDGKFNVTIEPYQFQPEYNSNEEDYESERDPKRPRSREYIRRWRTYFKQWLVSKIDS